MENASNVASLSGFRRPRVPPSQLGLNKGKRIGKYHRVVMREINLSTTFNTDYRRRLSDAHQRLILLRAAGRTANRLFDDFASVDHAKSLIAFHSTREPLAVGCFHDYRAVWPNGH